MAETRKKLDQVRNRLDNKKFLANAGQRSSPSRRRATEELAGILDKLEKLREEYGC